MLKALRHWVLDDDDSGEAPDPSVAPAERRDSEMLSPHDQRLSVRHDMSAGAGEEEHALAGVHVHVEMKQLQLLDSDAAVAVDDRLGQPGRTR